MDENEVRDLDPYDLNNIWAAAPDGVYRDGAKLLYSYCTSPEGYGSLNFCGIYRLANEEFWAFDGWTDTTGWGCRDGVDWYGPTTSAVEAANLLSQEHRREMGFEARAIPEDLFRDY